MRIRNFWPKNQRIDVAFLIKLTKFTFSARTGYVAGCPGKWKMYGSNDEINWNYIPDASNTDITAVYTDNKT